MKGIDINKVHIFVYQVVKCSDGKYYYYKSPLCQTSVPKKVAGLDVVEVVCCQADVDSAASFVYMKNKEVEKCLRK